jgi:hypothetical protein
MSNDRLFYINLDFESDERYDWAKFLEYTDNFDPLTSTFLLDVKNLSKQADYIVKKEEGRPDLVSFNYYGTIDYWAIILIYNDLDDVDDIKIGDRLAMPSIAQLEDLFLSLKIRQTASEAT